MKKIAKLAGFALGLIVLLNILSGLFVREAGVLNKYAMDQDSRELRYFEEPGGQIDVLVVGDSLCYSCLSPAALYRDYGITSYNLGKDMQKSVDTYYTIKRAIKTQPVKVVLWEVHNLTKQYPDLDPFGYGLAECIRYHFECIEFHNVWKKMIQGPSIRKYFKGYMVSELAKPYEKEVPYYDPNDVDEDWKLQYDQEHMLTKIQKLCEKEGLKLVLFSSASPKCYTNAIHVGLEKTAQAHGLVYLDANYDLDRVKIDWAQDTYDGGDHLNLFGVEKMTGYLGEYLAANCSLEDHRGDPVFSAWEEMLAAYKQEVIDMEGTDYASIERELGIKQKESLNLIPLDRDTYEDPK